MKTDQSICENSLDQLRSLYDELETQNPAHENCSDKVCRYTITVKHDDIDPNLLRENLKDVLRIVSKYKK